MIFAVSAAIFVATALGALALYWWIELRRESLPQRFKEVVAAKSEPQATAGGLLREWWNRIRRRVTPRRPGADEIVEMVTGKEVRGARLLLHQAGYRSPSSYRVYVVLRILLPVSLVILAVVQGKWGGLADPMILLFALAMVLAGLALPGVFLRMRVRKRQEDITDGLPDALDLLVVCVEAGLGINAAFVKVTEEFSLSCPALSEEFDVVNREMVAGKPRQEALRALAERTGVEDVKSLVAMLIQTEKLGTSLSQSLRVHSDSLRTRRRQRAEEAAAKTTIKLVFPLVFLLFPALFVVILGPGVIQVIRVLYPVAQR